MVDTVTISVEEYNNLRDTREAFEAFATSKESIGFVRGWYPRGGASGKHIEILQKDEVIGELLEEIQHLKNEARKYYGDISDVHLELKNAKNKISEIYALALDVPFLKLYSFPKKVMNAIR